MGDTREAGKQVYELLMGIIVQSGLPPLADGIAQARGTIDGKLHTLINHYTPRSCLGDEKSFKLT